MNQTNSEALKEVLDQIALDAVPGGYSPWPLIRDKIERRQPARRSMLAVWPKRLAPGLLAILLIVVALLGGTPQGRALAENAFSFFKRALSDVQPLSAAGPTEAAINTRTPASTFIPEIVPFNPADNPTDGLQTPTSSPEIHTGGMLNGLSLEAVQSLAGYPLRVPSQLPEGYRFVSANLDQETQAVNQIYQFFPYQAGEMIVINQAPLEHSPVATELVGQSATILPFSLGETVGEYVEGTWLNQYGTTQQEWYNHAPPYTFAWQDELYRYTVRFFVGDDFSPAYLTRQQMMDFLEVYFGAKSGLTDGINLNYLTDLTQAEDLAGFHILFPQAIPGGFEFSHAVYEPQNKRLILKFVPVAADRETGGVSLVILEMPAAALTEENNCDVSAGNTQAVSIIGAAGCLSMTGDTSASLHWRSDDVEISLLYQSSTSNPVRLGEAQLLEIARSMH